MKNNTNSISGSKKCQVTSPTYLPNSKISAKIEFSIKVSTDSIKRRSDNSSSYDISLNEKPLPEVKVFTLQRYLTLLNLRDFYLIKFFSDRGYLKDINLSRIWSQIVQNFKENYPSLVNSSTNNSEDFVKEYLPAFLDFLNSVDEDRLYLDDIKQSNNLLHLQINKHLSTFESLSLLSKNNLSVEEKLEDKSIFITESFLDFFSSRPFIPSQLKISSSDYNRLASILTDIDKIYVIPMMKGEVFDQKTINFLQQYLQALLSLHEKTILTHEQFAKFFLGGSVDRVVIACRDLEKKFPEKITKILENKFIKHHYVDLLYTFNVWKEVSVIIERYLQSCDISDDSEATVLYFQKKLNPYINLIFHEFILLSDAYLEKKYSDISVSKEDEEKKLEKEVLVLSKFLRMFYLSLKTWTIEVNVDKYSSIDFLIKIKNKIKQLILSIKENSPGYSSFHNLYWDLMAVVTIFGKKKIINFKEGQNLVDLGPEIQINSDENLPLFSIVEKKSL